MKRNLKKSRGSIRTLSLVWLPVFLLNFSKNIISYFKKVNLELTSNSNKKNTRLNLVSGFTILELLIVLSIVVLLLAIVIGTFVEFRKNQALSKDTEIVVEVLNQARNQTLSSLNQDTYGVHFASTTITLFSGASFAVGSIKEVINLNAADTVLTVTLSGGGTDVVFQRLTGETAQNGTVVVSAGLGQTKTVTIYKTGVIESQ